MAKVLLAILYLMLLGNLASAETCIASIHSGKDDLGGAKTASGIVWNNAQYHAAHKTLPFGWKIKVSHNDKSVLVKIVDRIPYIVDRCIAISPSAAYEIDCSGLCKVIVGDDELGSRELVVPDPLITPGVARNDLSKADICKTKWGSDERYVTSKMKMQVFANYGLTGNDDPACTPDIHGRRCEIDHLISRELGGADDVNNLWPQAYGSKPWNATLKDKLENRLHKEVCAGNISLEKAQKEISEDWRILYKKYFGEPTN